MKVNFPVPYSEHTQRFCIECNSPDVKYENEVYHCNACGKDNFRGIVFHPGMVMWLNPLTKDYWHESVGALIRHKGHLLVTQRNVYPQKLSIPSGHLEENETPYQGIYRELKEEIGIDNFTNGLNLFTIEAIDGDDCSRGSDNHLWHLYYTDMKEVPNIVLDSEHKSFAWATLEQIKAQDLTFPLKYFVEKYGNKLLE